MHKLIKAVAFTMAAGMMVVSSSAQMLGIEEQMAAKERVQTAVALMRIAEADGDGDAMLVAARLLESVGNVAIQDPEATGEPEFYAVDEVIASARSMGADSAKADAAVSRMSTRAEPRQACYWEFKCGTFDCAWVYNC